MNLSPVNGWVSFVFTMLVVFQIKHFLADFPLQGKYMLGKFKGGTDWILPLCAHAGVHGLLTVFIVGAVTGSGTRALGYGLFDFAMHFAMDRVKASPNLLGRWKPDKPYFWWALGADQLVHHLTGFAMIYGLINGVA